MADEDRGQSRKPPRDTTTRNQGGPSRSDKGVMPPPVSRKRADSVQRAGADGTNFGPPTSSQGSINKRGGRRGPPPVPPAKMMRRGGIDDKDPNRRERIARTGEVQPRIGGEGPFDKRVDPNVGPQRQSEPKKDFSRPVPPPPMPRDIGAEQSIKRESEQAMAEMGPPEMTGGDIPPSSPANVRGFDEAAAARPPGMGQSQPQVPPGMQGTDKAMGAMRDEAGGAVSTQPAQPQMDQSAEAMANNLAQQGSQWKMGEELLGMDMSMSQAEPSGREFQGPIGPGLPANKMGAVGVPGSANTPEDLATNRQRFDQALQQHKGDQFLAAQSTGAFPSGNPMAQGQMEHMKNIVESSDGDGVDVAGLDENTRRRYKTDAVRQLEEFGAYPGMDDPAAPSPPIRPLSFSFNPLSGKWVNPEGDESLIDRFGGKG